MSGLQSLFFFVVAIGVLVAFHEFGHFWVARRTGVKVIRFAIGFGKPLLSWQKSPTDTQFLIAAIPLGGYVKMVDEREGDVSADDLPYAFNRQALWKRSAIVAAGPVFNLMLAVILFWLILVIGETGIKPIVGPVAPGSLAALAGFQEQDEILSINQKDTPTWALTLDELLGQALNGQRDIVINVRTLEGEPQLRVLALSDEDVRDPEQLHQHLGLKPWSPKIPPVLGRLLPGDAAESSGLKSGDLVLSVDGQSVDDWQKWVAYIQSKANIAVDTVVLRDDVQMHFSVTPRQEFLADGSSVGKIGAGVEVPTALIDSLKVDYSYPVLDAVPLAFEKTAFYALATVKMIGKMFVGQASMENLSGPISIAQYAGQSAQMGFSAFLRFLALVSISLGVLNLLPVPVLDGGHLLFYSIEAVKGSPLSESTQVYFQKLGMAFLIGLMIVAMVMDVGRLLN